MDEDEKAKVREEGFVAGSRATARRLLMECARELGRADPLAQAAAMLAELEDTRRALRQVCEKYGDNNWDDNHYLADVVTKHLEPHIDDAFEDEDEEEGNEENEDPDA